MPVTVTSTTKTTHVGPVPWSDIEKYISDNVDKFVSTRPVLSVSGGGMPMGGMTSPGGSISGLGIAWNLTPQKLDEILRASIKDLPTLGLYVVSVPPNDPINALVVTWEEETQVVSSPSPA